MALEQERFDNQQNNQLNLADMINFGLRNWYWFVISLFICLGLAFLYIKSTSKVYTRTASVLIKDDSKGGGISESAAFQEVNLFNVKRNVDNEILVFKSVRLMRETARRLHLDISYMVEDGLRMKELYTQSPVLLSFPEIQEAQSFSLTAKPLSENRVELSRFQMVNEDGKQETKEDIITAELNDTIITPIGPVVVVPSLFYGEKYYNTSIIIDKKTFENVVQYYRSSLHATLASKTATIINLTLHDISIPRAEDILNTLIAVYNEEAINDKNQITVNTSDFINERLIIIEQELGVVDSDIESYKRSQQLTDIQSETGMYLQASSQYRQEELGLDNQITLAKYIREYLTDPSKSSDLIPANTGISDVNIEGQISEYNEFLLRRDKLISNSSSKNPVVMDLNNSLSAMKQTIIRAVDNLIVGLNIKTQNVRQREAQTSRRISAVPTQQKYVLSVERQQKIKEELYLYLLNKREENALTQAITESNARIIDAATGSNDPISPKTRVIILAAFLFGLMIPVVLFWFQNMLDTKVRMRKDVEDNTTIPFLGDIPLRDKKDKNELIVKENSRDSISEAFRIIRANMEFMQVKTENLQVIMLTSFNSGSGKTFVATNLAMTLALTGKKVILIDLDIRKGTLSSRYAKKATGITNYLSGKIDHVRDIIHKTELSDNLDMIYAGPVPPNPAELLLSERLDKLIAELREKYDYIILDNVPAGVVADATIVNRVADLTIYVIRAGMMDQRQLPELEKLYHQERFRNMSVILNGTNMNYSNYRYGYNNDYQYGYGSE